MAYMALYGYGCTMASPWLHYICLKARGRSFLRRRARTKRRGFQEPQPVSEVHGETRVKPESYGKHPWAEKNPVFLNIKNDDKH